jgi:hypothetical protein
MMKRVVLLMIFLAPLSLFGQNVQLHHDFGKERKFYTATFEMFKPDTLGSTFWFIDLDFDFPGKPRSMSSAYLEFAREFYLPCLKNSHTWHELAFHAEYDDGFAAFGDSSRLMGAASFNSVFLTGFSYPITLGSVTLTTQWLLRLPRGMNKPDFQFTVVWFQPLFRNKVLFTGFVDFWSQDQLESPDIKELVFQTEPQLWYLLNRHIGIGGEVEISRNFPYGPNPWQICPTLAVRWEF